jgi:hypothetical protein
MSERGLFVLLLATSLLLAGLALVQVGCGPYSVVYGPASALRAQRAFLFLTLVWTGLGALVSAGTLFSASSASRQGRCACSSDVSLLLPHLDSSLRC